MTVSIRRSAMRGGSVGVGSYGLAVFAFMTASPALAQTSAPKPSSMQLASNSSDSAARSTMQKRFGNWRVTLETIKGENGPPDTCIIKQGTVRVVFFVGELSSVELDRKKLEGDDNLSYNNKIRLIWLDSKRFELKTDYKKPIFGETETVVIDDPYQETSFRSSRGEWQPLDVIIDMMTTGRRMIVVTKDGSRRIVKTGGLAPALQLCRA